MSKPRLCDIASQIYKKYNRQIDSMQGNIHFRDLVTTVIRKHYDLDKNDIERCIDIIDLLSAREYEHDSQKSVEAKIASL